METINKKSSEISDKIITQEIDEIERKLSETNIKIISYGENNIEVESLVQITKQKISLTIKNANSIFKSNMIKSITSKKKCRFEYEGFNLDLTYITERIIAMGFPSDNIEKIYRNSAEEVKKFFNKRHKTKYKVYNLCSEREYPENTFEKQARYPFDDHEAPLLNLIIPFCLDVDEHLKADPDNVVAIHCKAGKGRTGTMICCYLLYNNFMKSADDAIKFYGMMRTSNGKGVTIPSQLRYIYYFEEILKRNKANEIQNFCIPSPAIFITKIIFFTIPSFHVMSSSKCTPDFIIENQGNFYKYKNNCQNCLKSYKNEAYVEFFVNKFRVSEDVKIKFFNKKTIGKEKMFSFWFHTYLIPREGSFQIKKSMLDKACKDKSNKLFDPNFKVEVQYIVEDNTISY